MIGPARRPRQTRGPFPDGVPILVDRPRRVTLRATGAADLPAIVEQCRDPETIRWTTSVPTPAGGYALQRRRGLPRVGPGRLDDGSRRRPGPSRPSGTASASSAVWSNLRLDGPRLGRDRVRAAPRGPGPVDDERGGPAGAGLRLRRARADHAPLAGRRSATGARGGWPRRPASCSTGRCAGCSTQRGELLDGWVATHDRRGPAYAAPRTGPGRAGRATGSCCGRSPRPTRTGSSRPAPTRGPGTGWSPCPARTAESDALSYLEHDPRAGRPRHRAGLVRRRRRRRPLPRLDQPGGPEQLRPAGGDRLLGAPAGAGPGNGHRGGPAGHRLRPVRRTWPTRS